MFDPLRRDELNERIADSDFVHLWNEYWRRVRIPKELGPPKGSFLDDLFARFDFSFEDEERLSADAVAAWFEETGFLNKMRRHLQTRYVPSDAFDGLSGESHAPVGMGSVTYDPPAARIPVPMCVITGPVPGWVRIVISRTRSSHTSSTSIKPGIRQMVAV